MKHRNHAFATLVAVSLATGCAQMEPTAAAPSQRYEVVARFPVGGTGGWDYPWVDEKRHRLYVTRGDHVEVLDTRSGEVVATIPGTEGVHGVALAEDLGLGFTSNGRSNSVSVFNLQTLAAVETVKVTGTNPDAILYDPFTKRVLTFNGSSANVTAIDAATRKVVGTIAVSGKPEFAVTNGRGQVFVNIEDQDSIAVIDVATLKVSRYFSLGGCHEPTGLAIDERRGLLISVCLNKTMAVVNAGSGSVVAELPIGSGADGVAFDPALGLALSSNGDGTLSVVKGDEAGRFAVADTVATQKSARTIALDSTTHRLYLPAASFGPPPPATAERPNPRPSMIPGSFVIVVLAPK